MDSKQPSKLTKGHEAEDNTSSVGYSRVVQTCCFALTYLSYGLCAGSNSTAMVDLKELTNTTVNELSIALSVRDAGHVLGALIGGPLANKYRHLTNIIGGTMVIAEGVLFLLYPWSPNFGVLCISSGFRGIVHGVSYTMMNTALIADWGKKAPAPMNALHMGYAVGLLLGPVITAPFLSPDDVLQQNVTSYQQNMTSAVTHWPDVTETTKPFIPIEQYTESKIAIPFGIIGLITVVPGAAFIIMYIAGWRYNGAGLRTDISSGSNSTTQTSKLFVVMMAFVGFMLFLLIACRDGVITEYVFYIAVNTVQMPKDKAAILNTANYGCWVLGRAVVTIIARWVPIYILSFGIIGISFAFNICLCLLGLKRELFYWIFVCMFQLFGSPLYACALTWMDYYVQMDGLMMSWVEFGGASGGFIYHFLGGYIIDNYGSIYIFVFSAVAAGLLLICMVSLQIFWAKKGNRFATEYIREISKHDAATESTPLLQSDKH